MNAPQGFARGGQAKPRDLIGTAIVTGAIAGHYPEAVLVPPARAGEGLLATYPDHLVTPTERRAGVHRKAGTSNPISHAREAWDIAGQGPSLWRVRDARRAFGRGQR
jgi:hypothetical protein